MDTIMKIVKHIAVGLSIGFICTTACLWIFGGYTGTGVEVMRMFTAWLCASVLYGLVSMIYHTGIKFPANLMIHFVFCVAVTFAAGWASGLFGFIGFRGWLVCVLPTFVIIYVIIGVLSVVLARYQAKVINEKISSKKVSE